MLSQPTRSMLLLCPPLGKVSTQSCKHIIIFLNLISFLSRVMACAFAPSGNLVACGYVESVLHVYNQTSFKCRSIVRRGLDNKVTVYPLSMEDDPNSKRKTVGTHTSYMSCCLFPNSDQQVCTSPCYKPAQDNNNLLAVIDIADPNRQRGFNLRPLGRGIGTASSELPWSYCRRHEYRSCSIRDGQHFRLGGNLRHSLRNHRQLVITFLFYFWLPHSQGCDRTALIWDMRTGQKVQAFEGHDADINSVKFYPSGEAIATGSDDATVIMIRPRSSFILHMQPRSDIFANLLNDF